MAFARSVGALALVLLCSGCGYVHFGRLPVPATPVGDAKLAEAFSNLTLEQKILKQELVLARREGDALRTALDRAGGGSAAEVTARLTETTRELAVLRASYAKLQAERASAPAAPAGGNTELAAVEEKLASTLRSHTQLQEENARLRRDLDRAQAENGTLASQLKTALSRHEQAQAALAQLNTELLAQKEARTRAEQAAAAMHAQLGVVMARGGTLPPSPGNTGESAAPAATLRIAKAPPAGASAELRVDPAQLRADPRPEDPNATAKRGRTHVVEVGDTLERIAQKYYGTGEKWSRIYAANQALLANGRPLTAGMELAIPE